MSPIVAAGLIAAYEADVLRHPMYHLGWGKNFSTADVVRAVACRSAKADDLGRARHGALDGSHQDARAARRQPPSRGHGLQAAASISSAAWLRFADWMRKHQGEWK
jgi:hypothetical protein